MAIKIDGLSNAIADTLKLYTKEVEEGIGKARETVAKDAAKELKASSPKGARKKKKYAQGWRAKKGKGRHVVHNATNHQLTHLLEKGHAKVNGGRVAPIVHIKPVEGTAIETFERLVEKVIRG